MSDENKTIETKTEPKVVEKKDKLGLVDSLKKFLNEHKNEFLKINWPNREDLIKKTITVIATSLVFGVIVYGLDKIYMFFVQFVTNLVV